MKLLSLIFLISSCNAAKEQSNVPPGDTISVKVNTSFTIKLSTSMGTGYQWSPADSAWTGYMTLDSVTVVNNIEGRDDGPDTQVFYFTATKKGETKLHFIRTRPWKKKDPPDKEKVFTILAE
ncbi:MAG: protease inhibitor I42 family protein [Bacteroidota bacterium]